MAKKNKNTAGEDDDDFGLNLTIKTADPFGIEEEKDEPKKPSDKPPSKKKAEPVTPEPKEEKAESKESVDQKQPSSQAQSHDPSKRTIDSIKSIVSSVQEEEWYKMNTTINLPVEIRDNLEILCKEFNLPVKGVVSGIIMEFIDQHFEEYHKIKKGQEKKSLKWRG